MMIIKAIGVKIGIGIVAAVVVMPLMATTIQAELESFLRNRCVTRDYFPDGVPEDVPNRHLNSLPEFKKFFSSSGWTTNQFIEGLICAITNNVKDENWVDEDRKLTAERAVWKLSEIDSPVVTNFFRRFNDISDNSRLKIVTIPAMVWRTNLEPEVMAYMRSLCVRTNVYCNVEYAVVTDMFEALETMPDKLKSAATNRVAKYIYYSIRHTTQDVADQDYELAGFIPAYANSLQRLSALQYVVSTTTNKWTRAAVQQELARLSAIPTNQLNNISWIAEDVTVGK